MYIPRYVIDANVINSRGGLEAMNELERLHRIRVIELLKTTTLDAEFRLAPPQQEKAENYRILGSAGPAYFTGGRLPDAMWGAPPRASRFSEIHNVVFGRPFPANTVDDNNKRSIRDALHLDQCWSNMADAFITNDRAILNSRDELLALGFDFEIQNPEECLVSTRRALEGWYGSIDEPNLLRAIGDLSRPILIGSNSSGPLSISTDALGPLLALGLGEDHLTLEAHLRDEKGSPLVCCMPNKKTEFHERSIAIKSCVINAAPNIVLGCHPVEHFSVVRVAVDSPPGWQQSDKVLLAAFVARSGHFVFYHGEFRDADGRIVATISKQHLRLTGAKLEF